MRKVGLKKGLVAIWMTKRLLYSRMILDWREGVYDVGLDDYLSSVLKGVLAVMKRLGWGWRGMMAVERAFILFNFLPGRGLNGTMCFFVK